MSQQPVQTVSGKLILLIKAGYWLALLIIAAMVAASFVLLQQTMATQQHNHTLLDIVGTQKTLSQRIVFLASATSAASRDKQPALVSALKQATAEFETNYDLLLEQTGADPHVAGHSSIRSRSRACFRQALPSRLFLGWA